RVPVQSPDPFAEVRLHLTLSPDSYGLFAAIVARADALDGGAVEPYVAPAEFRENLKAIKEFLSRAPKTMPFCVGEGAPPFAGPGSWMESVDAQLSVEVTSGLVESVLWHFG